ncbi:hypothetical protein HN604_00725 [archaeon]|jgi:hypothetical protein|nr:hypothetical protein [archaeon]MBT6182313.1 hypothetical protein [archaeon]MBT6606659.1 hypothetical protein [archaeon]MBT7251902.1 hypothetical protein [archaeon]MBT7660590.1 hypothetical protein [archaeon]
MRLTRAQLQHYDLLPWPGWISDRDLSIKYNDILKPLVRIPISQTYLTMDELVRNDYAEERVDETIKKKYFRKKANGNRPCRNSKSENNSLERLVPEGI